MSDLIYRAIVKAMEMLDKWASENDERQVSVGLKKKYFEFKMSIVVGEKVVSLVRTISRLELLALQDPVGYVKYVIAGMTVEMRRLTSEAIYNNTVRPETAHGGS